jgi:hypothetical protein
VADEEGDQKLTFGEFEKLRRRNIDYIKQGRLFTVCMNK